MRRIATLMANAGGYVVSLSNQARLRIVILGLLLLGGGSIYKLVVNIQQLYNPLPPATPDQLIKPMEKLLRQTSANVNTYRRSRKHDMGQLDSLARLYSNQKPRTR